MKAVGYHKSLPVTDKDLPVDFTADKPAPTGRDLRVAVKAVSVNPVDTKVRMRAQPAAGEPPKVLGYDAAGVVGKAVGPGGEPVQSGRRGVLRRLDPAPRH